MAEPAASPWSGISDLNLAYLLDQYDAYRSDPSSVGQETRALFDQWGPPAGSESTAPPDMGHGIQPRLVAGAVSLATAIRSYGHRGARLDPLGRKAIGDAALEFATHGITEEDLAVLPAEIIGGPVARRFNNALEAIRHLRQVYQDTSGLEFEHVFNAEERDWLRLAVESGAYRPPNNPIDEMRLLERLTEVGALERFLHSAFPGQTRFSLEGLGMMVPILDEILAAASACGTRSVQLGMAHRGRLNVLVHVLGKPYEQLIGEFLGFFQRTAHSDSGSGADGWTGDVKYHLDARRAYGGGGAGSMTVYLAPNPSHLEWVNPIVQGLTRASDEERLSPGPPRQDELSSLAVLIHGDAAFPGQGVVAETLNLSRLQGYRTGGTIHIIANNQLGFTTPSHCSRSTLYASDLAKGFEIPVIHVNADDPEACLAAARLAQAYRERFRRDVLIDLVGYRRWGHNEGDEPAFTQPTIYTKIAGHPTVRDKWAAELVHRGLVTLDETRAMLQKQIEALHVIRTRLQQGESVSGKESPITAGMEAGGTHGGVGHQGIAAVISTAVLPERLVQINREVFTLPAEFSLHPKLEKPFSRRRELLTEESYDERVEWAHAEALAFATILADGTPIRLTGQDVCRGTFSHRHAGLFDTGTAASFIPLQHIPSAAASFQVWDSPLSESATLGFEFGYSVAAPETLVIWEAQYGDFVNVPQAIIDQFIVSARSKWDQLPSLVMLLPHGYEGQGPEHSSARPERFLQMAAEDNLRIANCTTAAQYFHVLRRQARMLKLDPRPLILLTPKSLLRNPSAASPFSEFAGETFRSLLPDDRPVEDPNAVRRLVFCSGKVYHDFHAAREKSSIDTRHIVALRLEELYPFPDRDVARFLERYPNTEEVIWLQEEPRNMGCWTYAAPRLRDLLTTRLPLYYVGRTRRSSPAEGSHHWHVVEQQRLIGDALAPRVPDQRVDSVIEPGPVNGAANGGKARVGRSKAASSRSEVKHAG